MTCTLKRLALLALTWAVLGITPAHARGYPPGYGAYGWGGWGGVTVGGSTAAGMGAFAAGAGQYNAQTAQARSMNVDTAMKYNDYFWSNMAAATQRECADLVEGHGAAVLVPQQRFEQDAQRHRQPRNRGPERLLGRRLPQRGRARVGARSAPRFRSPGEPSRRPTRSTTPARPG